MNKRLGFTIMCLCFNMCSTLLYSVKYCTWILVFTESLLNKNCKKQVESVKFGIFYPTTKFFCRLRTFFEGICDPASPAYINSANFRCVQLPKSSFWALKKGWDISLSIFPAQCTIVSVVCFPIIAVELDTPALNKFIDPKKG